MLPLIKKKKPASEQVGPREVKFGLKKKKSKNLDVNKSKKAWRKMRRKMQKASRRRNRK